MVYTEKEKEKEKNYITKKIYKAYDNQILNAQTSSDYISRNASHFYVR